LPADKLHNLISTVRLILDGRKKVTLREMQSLIGKLNFANRAVVPGRAFSRRLIDATCGIKEPHHRIRVTEAMKEDLRLWLCFLTQYNGRSMILDSQWVDGDHLQLYTDAAESVGFGAFFQGQWTHGCWPEHWAHSAPDITFKELFPIVLALHLWANHLENQRVWLHCDNQAVVHIINKQSSRSPASMRLLRMLILSCLKHNILCKAKHIAGKKNVIADALSRGQLGKFRALAPGADPHPAAIPPALMELFRLK
jgi:hypothetical protein